MIKKGPGNTPGNFVESCIAAVIEFQYIFGEQKQTLPSHTRVRGITPGEIFNSASLLESFSSTSLENEN